MSKWRVAIIGIGFVIGVAMLFLGGENGKNEESVEYSVEDYSREAENKLTAICEAALGCDVEVFITYEEGFVYSYALDSRGGVVTVGSGSGKQALVERVFMPKVSGVGIVCRGDYDEARLLELVSSSLGVGKNKIFITGTKKSSSIS